MKSLKLLIKNRGKQLLVVLAFRLSAVVFIVVVGILLLVEISILNFIIMGAYTLLILVFVIGTKETYFNIKTDLLKYKDPYITLENLEE